MSGFSECMLVDIYFQGLSHGPDDDYGDDGDEDDDEDDDSTTYTAPTQALCYIHHMNHLTFSSQYLFTVGALIILLLQMRKQSQDYTTICPRAHGL